MNLPRQVWELLKEGYGSEDIAIRLGVDLDEVRRCISMFRARGGKLAGLYRRMWRKEGEK